MNRKVVSVDGLGHGAQPIPLGVTIGPLLVTGNVSGVDPATGDRPAELHLEIEMAFANVERVLSAAGFRLADVAKVDVLLRERDAREALNETWIRVFPDPADRPARHTSFGELPKSLRIQLAITAYRV